MKSRWLPTTEKYNHNYLYLHIRNLSRTHATNVIQINTPIYINGCGKPKDIKRAHFSHVFYKKKIGIDSSESKLFLSNHFQDIQFFLYKISHSYFQIYGSNVITSNNVKIPSNIVNDIFKAYNELFNNYLKNNKKGNYINKILLENLNNNYENKYIIFPFSDKNNHKKYDVVSEDEPNIYPYS